MEEDNNEKFKVKEEVKNYGNDLENSTILEAGAIEDKLIISKAKESLSNKEYSLEEIQKESEEWLKK